MRHRAFTIIEVAITLCILSILSAIALPRAGAFLDSIHVRGAVTEIESMFSSARHLAIARGERAMVEVNSATGTVTVSVDGVAERSRNVGMSHGVSLTATRPGMTYSPTGAGYGAANLSVVVRRRRSVDTVLVSRLGRVRH